MTTEYRKLDAYERVLPGDQFKSCTGLWVPTDIGERGYTAGFVGFEYRRPITRSQAIPQWKHPDAPGCPVHVLWAESPSTVRTVAQVAAEAKPEALEPKIEPGTGYRLLRDDEIVRFGDQWHNPGSSQGDWNKVSGSVGKVVSTMTFTYRRKLPADPQYRPYANAAEAAAGLQGKLIHKKDWDWVPVTRVCEGSVLVGNLNPTFKQLLEYEFTDGTPCGVLITNQGKQ